MIKYVQANFICFQYCTLIMSERLVEIPVTRKLREEIKKIKKEKSYNEFLDSLIKNKRKGQIAS